MSTGADLRYVEKEKGEWYYEYQCYPYGCNEDYDVVGPFASEDAAREHCDDNNANAGGSWTLPYKGKTNELSGKPTKPRRRRSFW
jgi:hypothetical protein